jgi:hypothetical protein
LEMQSEIYLIESDAMWCTKVVWLWPHLRIYDNCPTNLNYLLLIDILEIATP